MSLVVEMLELLIDQAVEDCVSSLFAFLRFAQVVCLVQRNRALRLCLEESVSLVSVIGAGSRLVLKTSVLNCDEKGSRFVSGCTSPICTIYNVTRSPPPGFVA